MLWSRRRIVVVVAVALAIVAEIAVHRALVSAQEPKTFWDSTAYLETASRPFAFEQVYFPKPVFTSVVYRVLSADVNRIAGFQEWFSLLAWLGFAAALVSVLRSTRARIAAGVLVAVWILDPVRLGYCDAILSESLNDSLLALVLAGALRVASSAGRARRAWAGATAVVIAGWMFTRDTNAMVVLVALPVLAVSYRKQLRAHVAAVACGGGAAIVAVFSLWSANVAPGALDISVEKGWAADFTARSTYALVDNILERVVPDPEARAFFVERGLPRPDELPLDDTRWRLFSEPGFSDFRAWVNSSGRGTWLAWLARHPVDRVVEIWDNTWFLLGTSRVDQLYYMPVGWVGHRALPKTRGVFSEHWLLVVLLLALPWLVVRTRSHRLAPLCWTLIASGFVGSVAAMYGDTAEVVRHCYGSGQQILMAMWVLALLALSRSPDPG